MKSGIFHFIKQKMTKDSKVPFSSVVYDSLATSRDKTQEEKDALSGEVLATISNLRDGEAKQVLTDSVTDLYTEVGKALENKESISKVLDSLYEKADKETKKAFEEEEEKEEEEEEEKEKEETKDTDGKGKNSLNITDSALQGLFDKLDASLDSKIKTAFNEAIGIDDKKTVQDSLTEEDLFGISPIDINQYI